MQKQEGVVRIRVSIDESGNVLSKELKNLALMQRSMMKL